MSNGFLLDTHALLWWLVEVDSLSKRVVDTISDGNTDIYVSPVAATEIGVKWRKGKLAEGEDLVHRLEAIILEEGFRALPITIAHADFAATARLDHDDPWDRILYAQAKLEGLTLMTCDRVLVASDVTTFW